MKTAISKPAFRKWLKSKHPDISVGLPRVPDCCPVAQYLNQTQGAYCAAVTADHFTLGDGRRANLPYWAQSFVLRVDAPLNTGPITAIKALEILEGIP